jgi:hypothetical protein
MPEEAWPLATLLTAGTTPRRVVERCWGWMFMHLCSLPEPSSFLLLISSEGSATFTGPVSTVVSPIIPQQVDGEFVPGGSFVVSFFQEVV